MIKFPRRRVVGRLLLSTVLLACVAGCTPKSVPGVSAGAPGGHDHELEPVVVTVFTDRAELFMEYPRLVPGLEARFLAHVTVLATGEPVRSGKLRLELSRSADTARVLEAPEPARDGLFIPVGAFETPGEYEARIVVDSDQIREVIPLPPVIVHADHDAAHDAAHAEEEGEPAGAVSFLLEQQWKIGLLLGKVETRSLTRRLLVPGEIEAPTDARAVVSAPLAGILHPPDSGPLPRIGDRVERGQVLGYLDPPLTLSDTAQLAANEQALDALEMELLLKNVEVQTRTLELEQTLHEAQARLEFARQALERIEGLRTKDLGTVAELEERRRDVEVARREVEGARALKVAYSRARERLDALKQGIEGLGAEPGSRPRQRIPLVAPISGEIIEASRVQGESIDGQEPVFRILDLRRVWITTHVSEFDLGGVGESPGALLTVASYPDRIFDVLNELKGRIVNIGRVVDPETRTLPVRYEAVNPDGLLRAGMFADVYLETARSVDAVAVPEEAIVRDNGRPIAFVLLDGETFQKRDLELGIRDGRYVEVLKGLEPGERIVTRGAYLVKLAAASPSSFGEGHVH